MNISFSSTYGALAEPVEQSGLSAVGYRLVVWKPKNLLGRRTSHSLHRLFVDVAVEVLKRE
jgi:hypothetical protein